MKTKQLFTLFLAGLMVTGLVTTAWAQLPTLKMTAETPNQITTPDKVETPAGP
jgi:hypothetical protein